MVKVLRHLCLLMPLIKKKKSHTAEPSTLYNYPYKLPRNASLPQCHWR